MTQECEGCGTTVGVQPWTVHGMGPGTRHMCQECAEAIGVIVRKPASDEKGGA
jgi:hypothetical protein